MPRTDPVVLATLRNKASNENLKAELAKVDRSNQSEVRKIKTAQQRLNHRYKFKTNAILPPPKVAESQHIRMYETHNPGFCYRKDGTCRRAAIKSEEVCHAYEELKELLFTDDAIDARKVACLHVVSSHSPDVHTEVWDECCRGTTSCVQSTSACLRPAIKAIISERSARFGVALDKPSKSAMSFTKLLPVYLISGSNQQGAKVTSSSNEILIKQQVLDNPSHIFDTLADDKYKCNMEDDKCINVFVNTEVQLLVDSILEALQDSNPEKLNDIVSLLHSPREIKDMFRQPKTKRFLESLYGNNLVCGGKCFRSLEARLMENPIRRLKVELLKVHPKNWRTRITNKDLDLSAVRLQMFNIPESLERLVNEISQNVLREVLSKSGITFPASPMFLTLDIDEENKLKSLKGLNTLKGSPVHIVYEDSSEKKKDDAQEEAVSLDQEDVTVSCKCTEEEGELPLKKSSCEACNQQNVSMGRPQKPRDNYVKNTILDKVTLSRLERTRTAGQKYAQKTFERLKREYGVTQHNLDHPNKVIGVSFRKKVDRDVVKNSILRRLSNSQRLTVGLRAAKIKSHQVNMEGNTDPTVKSPLRELVGPVLTKDAILAITTPEEEYERDLLLFSKVQDLPNDAFIPRKTPDTATTAPQTPIKISAMNLAKLKLAVKTKETKKKVSTFLKKAL